MCLIMFLTLMFPAPIAASEDQGYSTESDTSSLYTCGGSLVFALKEEDHPTGEVYVSKGLKTPKINTFLLVFGSGYITFEAPMDMVCVCVCVYIYIYMHAVRHFLVGDGSVSESSSVNRTGRR